MAQNRVMQARMLRVVLIIVFIASINAFHSPRFVPSSVAVLIRLSNALYFEKAFTSLPVSLLSLTRQLCFKTEIRPRLFDRVQPAPVHKPGSPAACRLVPCKPQHPLFAALKRG